MTSFAAPFLPLIQTHEIPVTHVLGILAAILLAAKLFGEIAGLADRGRAEIDDDLSAPDVPEDTIAFEHRAHMLGAGQAKKQQIAPLDDIGNGGCDVGAVGRRRRSWLRRAVLRLD